MKTLLQPCKKAGLVLAMVVFAASFAQAQRTASVNGLWSSTTTWGGAAVPTSTDAVTINSGVTVTVDITANCASIDFLSTAAANSTVSINPGITLTVAGAVTIPRQGTNNNTMAVGAGILNAGSIAFTNGGGGQRHFLTISTGTVTVSGNVTQAGSSGSATITFTGAGLLKLGGSFLTSGTATFTANAGTVEYNAAGAQTIGDFTYNNLILSGSGTKSLTAATNAGGTLTVLAGVTLNLSSSFGATTAPTNVVLECGAATGSSITGGSTLTLGGNVTVNDAAGAGTGGATISSPVALGGTRTFTVADDGSTASDLSLSGVISGNSFGITKAGAGTLTLSAANSYTGATTITNGELRLNPAANITPNSQYVLNGGKLSTTGITATRTITNSSTLNLNANSSIDLGSNDHSLKFANSSAIGWAGTTLTINGWTGTGGASGTGGKIFFGTSASALSAAQLAKINFNGFPGTPILLATGELVPALAIPILAITGTTNHGNSCINIPATTITYTITNTGTATANGVTVVSNNSQFVVSNLSSTSIPGSGGTAIYQVVFTPGSSGAKNATITVASTTTGSNSPTSSLSGAGNPSPITAVLGQSDASCFAGSDGTIIISGSGGTGPYSYSVNNGLTWVASATNPYIYPGLSAGVAYKIRVKDNNGCTSRSVQ